MAFAIRARVQLQRDIGASLASGSYRTEGMIVAPCSIKTLSGIERDLPEHIRSNRKEVEKRNF